MATLDRTLAVISSTLVMIQKPTAKPVTMAAAIAAAKLACLRMGASECSVGGNLEAKSTSSLPIAVMAVTFVRFLPTLIISVYAASCSARRMSLRQHIARAVPKGNRQRQRTQQPMH